MGVDVFKSFIKWIAITVLGLAFMLIFKGQISSILSRTKSVSISTKGIVLNTPLGFTDVTRYKATKNSYSKKYPRENFEKFYMENDGYVISRPNNSNWKTPEEVGDYEISSVRGYSFSLVTPNMRDRWAGIIVRIYPLLFGDIKAAVQGFFIGAGEGLEYDEPKFDTNTQSATLTGYDHQEEKITVSRIFLVDGRLYDLRAIFSESTPDIIKTEMNSIVNSFYLLR